MAGLNQEAVRLARVCSKCGAREFLSSEDAAERWRCSEHPGADVIAQENRPYFGRDTSGGPARKLSDVELAEFRAHGVVTARELLDA